MPKNLIECQITTKAARARLSKGCHWRSVDPNIHLGYRPRGARGGNWVVRWYAAKRYQQHTLGAADDFCEADGVNVFSFTQALGIARAFVEQSRLNSIAANYQPLTVRVVIEAYTQERNRALVARGSRREAGDRLQKHVLTAALADKELHQLSESDFATWRDSLSPTLARSTVTRIINDLKAALNMAARANAKRLQELGAAHLGVVVKNGLSSIGATAPVARDQVVLTDPDVRRVVEAAGAVDMQGEWNGDLERLVLVLAATGARFSQVIRMQVGDVQAAQSRVMIPVSHKGRGAKAISRIAVPVGADVIEALRPCTAGRRGQEVLLLRPRWKQTSPTMWRLVGREPWKSPSEMSRPWRRIITTAGLCADVPPYSLRHSSIVRALRAALPIRLVAALHDTSTSMIESHYAAFIVSALDELAAKAVIPLRTADVSDVRLRVVS